MCIFYLNSTDDCCAEPCPPPAFPCVVLSPPSFSRRCEVEGAIAVEEEGGEDGAGGGGGERERRLALPFLRELVVEDAALRKVTSHTMFEKNPFLTPLFDTPSTSTNRRTLFDSQVNRGGLKQVSSNNAVETPPARGRVSLMCHFSSSSSSSLTYAHTFYEKRKCWRWPGYTHMMMHTTTTIERAILPHVPSPTSCSDTACLTEDKNIHYKNRGGRHGAALWRMFWE